MVTKEVLKIASKWHLGGQDATSILDWNLTWKKKSINGKFGKIQVKFWSLIEVHYTNVSFLVLTSIMTILDVSIRGS